MVGQIEEGISAKGESNWFSETVGQTERLYRQRSSNHSMTLSAAEWKNYSPLQLP
jgi:hypothetical protein